MKSTFSYTEMDLWIRDPNAYIRRYVEGIEDPPSDPMKLGRTIHKALEQPDYDWAAELQKDGFTEHKQSVVKKLLKKMEGKRLVGGEVTLRATTPNGVQLISILDGYDHPNKILGEYKTSDWTGQWTQYRVDENTQLSFYAYVFKLIYFSFFKDIQLHALNTQNGTVKSFHTARGPKDIAHIADLIDKTVQEMKDAGVWEQRLSREDKIKKNMTPLFI